MNRFESPGHLVLKDLEGVVEAVAHGQISRRQFLERALAMGVSVSAIGTVLAACGREDASPSRSPEAMDTTLPAKLFVYNWVGMVAPSVFKRFESKTGVRVVETYYANNEELLTKLKAGATGYDIVNPQDYMAAIMIKTGLLRPLDMRLIPNIEGAVETLRRPTFDPETDGNKYTVPFAFNTTGIGVRLDKVKEEIGGWASLWDPQYRGGGIVMFNGARECLSTTLFVLGHSPNSTVESEIEEAKQKLIEQKPLVLKYTDLPSRDIVAGAALTWSWDGEVTLAMRSLGTDKVGYVLPEEGYSVMGDGYSIPRAAPSPYAAHLFLNLILEPEMSGVSSEFSGYACAVTAGKEYVKDPFLLSMWPSESEVARGIFLEDLGSTERLYQEAWFEVKAS